VVCKKYDIQYSPCTTIFAPFEKNHAKKYKLRITRQSDSSSL